MPYGILAADQIQSSVTGSSIGPGNATRFKNRIINGDMRIDQRNVGVSLTPTNGAYSLDRWSLNLTQASKFTVQQSTTAPTGFGNSLKITSSSAYSVVSGDYFALLQCIEAQNITDFAFGTANAKTVTLSFWVYSSLTGTFGGAARNYNADRSYPFSYTINSANTWEQKTVTFTGDTTGTWNTTGNSGGLFVIFSLGAGSTLSGTANTWQAGNYIQPTGSTSVLGTNGATLYFSGVQLEVGSYATGFDYVDQAVQLQMCQRYFEKSAEQSTAILSNNDSGWLLTALYNNIGNNEYYGTIYFKVTKRAAPTVVTYPYGTASNTGRFSNDVGSDYAANSATTPNGTRQWGFNVANNSGGSLTVGSQKLIIGAWYASAEL